MDTHLTNKLVLAINHQTKQTQQISPVHQDIIIIRNF